jgi:hypothetical protein
MIVGGIVAFVVLALGTLINHMLTTNEKNKQEKSIHIQQLQKKSSDIFSHSDIHAPIINEPEQHFAIIEIPDDEYHYESIAPLLGFISFCLFYSLRLISLIL